MIDPVIEPERRRAVRQNATFFAVISNPGGVAVPCKVLNLSRFGARLRVDRGSAVPRKCQLWIEGEWPRECHVVWRRDDDLAVAFRDSEELN